MSNSTPQKRKSLPLEKKLEIYEFEVDENEPKTKQKKKRGPKPGTKHKLNWGSTKKGPKKKPFKCEEVNKGSSVNNPSVPLVQKEVCKRILSTKNSSSPLFENKIRPFEESHYIRESFLFKSKKENCTKTFQETSVKGDIHEGTSCTRKRSHRPEYKKSFRSRNEDNLSLLEQKENLTHQTSETSIRKCTSEAGIVVSSTENASSLKSNKEAYGHSLGKLISSPEPTQDQNIIRQSLEVPILFHNHQDGTLSKNKISQNLETAAYTSMSDEVLNKSYGENSNLDHFFSSSIKPSSESSKLPSRSSLHHDSSYEYQINASTPVKCNYNDTCSSNSVQNCFGFDELELFEEPLVSPIKISEANGSSLSGVNQTIPYKSLQRQSNSSVKKEEIPVKQVIKLLKYGPECEENNLETRSKSSSSNSPSPIFIDPPPLEEDKPEKIMKPVARRSYERPSYLKKKNKSFEENSDEDIDEETVKPSVPKKRHQGQSKKEQDEMQKWINAFNSQCQEIEQFDLLVE